MNNIIAIDPGSSSGAVAWHLGSGIEVRNMPESGPEILRMFQDFDRLGMVGVEVVMEDVGGSMPGNSARSARTFAVHQGYLEMAAWACGFKLRKVGPRRWMEDVFGKGVLPKAPKGSTKQEKAAYKAARKQAIYDGMVKRHVGLEFTKRQADALAILTWAMGEQA